ncbi:protein angel [Lucilia sericata]|uniref:protein angel n=1 Tax=Lucilia sericata TaxID=13632 RepID=UPI0018A8187B|nr:protein angel [Lucilia sericata]
MLKLCCVNSIQSSKTINALFYHVQSTDLRHKRVNSKKSVPMNRKWKHELFRSENGCVKGKRNYKLLSYNILAQDLLVEHLQLYYGIDNKMLRWQSRLSKLKDEIGILAPDIMCLQEMQYDHLKELVNQFGIAKQNSRLEYVFKKKTGTRSDGCVIIYDKNKFKLIEEKNVEYYTDDVSTLNRENIAVMVKFQPLEDNSSTFVVATTHLLYNPRREDVRISQVNKLIQEIIEFSNTPQSIDMKNRLPVILTGDFNFTPDTKAFELLTGLRKPKLRPENCEAVQSVGDFFQMDAIDFGMDNGASTYQDQWITVDYILKSKSNRDKKSIQITSKYKLPSTDQCWRSGKIPNKFVGSDHFSLAIQFSIV